MMNEEKIALLIDELKDIRCNNFGTGTDEDKTLKEVVKVIEALEQQPKIGFCRDCQQWKDSDGVFRRGIDAESKCPINRIEVYEGTGYCYMFK